MLQNTFGVRMFIYFLLYKIVSRILICRCSRSKASSLEGHSFILLYYSSFIFAYLKLESDVRCTCSLCHTPCNGFQMIGVPYVITLQRRMSFQKYLKLRIFEQEISMVFYLFLSIVGVCLLSKVIIQSAIYKIRACPRLLHSGISNNTVNNLCMYLYALTSAIISGQDLQVAYLIDEL